ncbi:hypothetical protein JHK85_057429 [Glycine max]|nr:hypothetical protein JHK85_057429 [Glycine max]
MVSKNPNPSEAFYLDPSGMSLPGILPFAAAATATADSFEDPAKKTRKPYTITKSRESWTEPEHDKFLEALQLLISSWYQRITLYISLVCIRVTLIEMDFDMLISKDLVHCTAPVLSQVSGSFQSSSALLEPGYILKHDSSAMPKTPIINTAVSSWSNNSLQKTTSVLHGQKQKVNNCCSSSRSPRAQLVGESNVLPDFAEVYSFIGSVFDPNVTGHVQKLKRMDPIDVETVLLLMRNLSINLASPDFEDHRRLLASYEVEPEVDKYKCRLNHA